jgi:hypothetical protein
MVPVLYVLHVPQVRAAYIPTADWYSTGTAGEEPMKAKVKHDDFFQKRAHPSTIHHHFFTGSHQFITSSITITFLCVGHVKEQLHSIDSSLV